MSKKSENPMEKIVSLAKRRGFVFPSSEIYGGLGAIYDYGHYGTLLKNNIRDGVHPKGSAVVQVTWSNMENYLNEASSL
jgi:glycyl-tRNA synthetase (class II)